MIKGEARKKKEATVPMLDWKHQQKATMWDENLTENTTFSFFDEPISGWKHEQSVQYIFNETRDYDWLSFFFNLLNMH